MRRKSRCFRMALGAGLWMALSAIAHAQNPPVDSAAMHANEAHATTVTGQVTRIRDAQPWALSSGEQVPIQQVISTGGDGYARFVVAGGSSFELLSNSRIVFRQNMASAGDLLDVVGGRVRIHLRPSASQPQQRVFTPVAIVTALQPAIISVAVDEDDSVRIDVLEGEVRVQHKLRPRNEPTIVRAVDAILVQPNEQISRRVDRGSLYRYTVKPLHNLWTAVTPGHSSHAGEPIEGNKFLAERMMAEMPDERKR
ncbi:MAG TPA: FecR domain-containing protein [Bryobacteraceae bacterium]|nr:FecR domain-containing protein [Bryobacteraceae bacterium]